ncbi:MAG: MBL fold metallo-hydrolase [Coprobacillaceae bacterium]
MKVKKLILGNMQTNAYIINNDKKECLIIDPGAIEKKVVNYIESEELHVFAILLTHGHFDHIGAVDYLYNKYQCPIYIHGEDIPMLKEAKLNLSVFEQPFILNAPVIEASLDMELIDFHIKWLHLPGHTPGSSMLYFVNENIVFSGDVLFKGSIGRFDFPLSSHHDTKQTLLKIKDMEIEAAVYPGHGEATTLSEEKHNNPYLQ